MSKRTVELDLATPSIDAQGRPTRVPVGLAEPDLAGEHMLINLGPQHPATHGVLLLHKKIKGESLSDRALREEHPLDDKGLRLPPDQIDEISEPFGNSVHQFRSA